MKRTIFGIILGSLLLSASLAVGLSPSTNQTPTTSFADDVPEWTVGDSWTYKVNSLNINYDESGQVVKLNGTIDDFTWTVTDTSDSLYYTVSYTGKLTAVYDFTFTSSSGTIHATGTFNSKFVRLKGTILFTKDNLQIHQITAEIKGLTAAVIAPLKIRLPIPFQFIMQSTHSDDFPLFDFPLSTPKIWGLPAMDITLHCYAGGIFGLIGFPITFGISYSWNPLAFFCLTKGDVTVPAGTYSAYTITTIIGSFFEYYYAPAVGNLIKIDVALPNGAVSAELKSTTYS
jgi:hypothetical protein